MYVDSNVVDPVLLDLDSSTGVSKKQTVGSGSESDKKQMVGSAYECRCVSRWRHDVSAICVFHTICY